MLRLPLIRIRVNINVFFFFKQKPLAVEEGQSSLRSKNKKGISDEDTSGSEEGISDEDTSGSEREPVAMEPDRITNSDRNLERSGTCMSVACQHATNS